MSISDLCLLLPTRLNRMSDLIDKHPCLRRNQPPRRHHGVVPTRFRALPLRQYLYKRAISHRRTAAPASQSGVRMIPAPSTAACKSASELSEISGPVSMLIPCLGDWCRWTRGSIPLATAYCNIAQSMSISRANFWIDAERQTRKVRLGISTQNPLPSDHGFAPFGLLIQYMEAH